MIGATLLMLLVVAVMLIQLITGQTVVRLGGEWQTRKDNPYLFWWCIVVDVAVLTFAVFEVWGALHA